MNRRAWDEEADAWVERGRRDWARDEIAWGVWHVPEPTLRLLPDLDGADVVELGCGTGYVSSWLARRGARPIGLDNSSRQLSTAAMLQREFGVSFPLVHGDAERVPLRDAIFDLAISEYGAAIWADPYKWIPEAHRLLRPGGLLVFLGHHPLTMIVVPREGDVVTDHTLRYPYFGMHRIDWVDSDGDSGTEFNLPISGWLALFEKVGFDVVSYQEVQNPETDREKSFDIDPVWASDFPSEQVWKLLKR